MRVKEKSKKDHQKGQEEIVENEKELKTLKEALESSTRNYSSKEKH